MMETTSFRSLGVRAMLFGYNSSREGGVASHSQGSLVDISTRLNLEFTSFSFCMIEIVNITNIRRVHTA